jgi:hypothetical protein
MSDLTSHTRDDLVELPSDCEPPHRDPHLATECPECRHGLRCSPALCNRRRELHARLHASVRMLDGDATVVDLASVRARRAK